MSDVELEAVNRYCDKLDTELRECRMQRLGYKQQNARLIGTLRDLLKERDNLFYEALDTMHEYADGVRDRQAINDFQEKWSGESHTYTQARKELEQERDEL